MGFFDKLFGRARGVVRDLEEAIDDPEVSHRNAVEDAKKQIEKFSKSIVDLKASLHQARSSQSKSNQDHEKFMNIARAAKSAGNMDDAREALEKANEAKSEADSYGQTIERNEGDIDKMLNLIKQRKKEISKAESQFELHRARIQSSKIRDEMNAAKNELLDSASPFDALNKLEKKADEMEAKSDALEDFVGDTSSTNLEDKYGSGSSTSLDDQLANL